MNKIVEALESNMSAVKGEKPLAYFDQNILDILHKYIPEEHSVSTFFTEDFQVVYSDITLAEIHKAGVNGKNQKYTDNFLDVLTRLNAQHISLMFVDGKVINRIFRSFETPKFHYEAFLDNLKFDEFINPMQKTNLAIFGGIKDYDAFKGEHMESMQGLLDYLRAQIELMKENHYSDATIDAAINFYTAELKKLDSQMDDFNRNTESIFNEIAEKTENKPGHLAFRDHLNIDINKLKAIESPNILQKIAEYIFYNNRELNQAIDSFFNLDKSYSSPEREPFIFEKVTTIYTMLNLIGYYEDEKLKIEDKYFRSLHDMNHASYACFCEYFFTNDNRLVKKTQAAYEYLNIATQICSLNLK